MEEIGFESLVISLRKSEENLNNAYRRFVDAKPYSQEFFEIRLQCCIFQFDLLREMVSVLKEVPKGFAESVALKGIVHRLFEYDLLIRTSLRPRLILLAKNRNVEIDSISLIELERQSRPALKTLRKWIDVRNKAAGHYDANLRLQVDLIKSLEIGQIMDVASEFIRYNLALLIILRDVGEGRPQKSSKSQI